MNFARTLLAGTIATGLASAAAAAIYTDQASFLAANPGLGLVSFEGQVIDFGPDLGTNLSFGGIDFQGTKLNFVDTAFWGSVDSLLDDRFGSTLTASFAPTPAIGFYFASGYNDGVGLDFTAYNGTTALFSTTLVGGGVRTSFTYFGLDGIGPITSIVLDSAPHHNSFVSIAEISLAVVPEPATWAMLIAGFGLVGLRLRRRQTMSADNA